MSESELNRKRLAMGIVEYLDKSVAENFVSGDAAESLEIAKQCIADAFQIDSEDAAQVKELSLKPFSLDKVFEVYLNAQAKVGSTGTSATTESPAEAPAPSGPTDEDRKRADELKAEGNALVSAKQYPEAIAAYTKAIEIVGDNAVYYGNRAAAHSQNGDHAEAVNDAEKALEIDPNYVRAYSRLGRAFFGLGKLKEAVEAYEKGLEMDPGNTVMQSSLDTIKSKLGSLGDVSRSSPAANADSGASASAGAGAGAGGFDFASIMNNPALMSMAQNMMANGGLDSLMSNPAIAQMASNYASSGQMPNMSDLMNNPEIANLTSNLSGMGGSGSGSGSNSGANPLASLLNNPGLMNMAQQFMNNNNNSGRNSGGNNNGGGDNENNHN